MSFDHLTALKHINTKQRVIFHGEICVLKQICVQNENIWVFRSFSVYLRGKTGFAYGTGSNAKKDTWIKIKRKNFAKAYYANTQFNKQPKIECKPTWNDINNPFCFRNVTYFLVKLDIQWGTKIISLNIKVTSSLNYIKIKVLSEAKQFLWILKYNDKLVCALLKYSW